MSYYLNKSHPHHVQVWLNDDEYQNLNLLVASTSLNREQVLRKLIAGMTIKEAPSADYGAIIRKLNCIGNNVNQVAAKIHTHGFVDEPMLKEAVQSLHLLETVFTKAFSQEA